jgi:hypothetical protein
MNQLIRPDWEYWSKLTEVTLWNALLLAQDLCPNNYVPGGGMDKDHDYNYHKRLMIADELIRQRAVDWITVRGPFIPNPQDIYVSMPKFVKWYVEDITTKVPDEFKRLYSSGYNLRKRNEDYVSVARKCGHTLINEAYKNSWQLTQDVLAKKIAKVLNDIGVRGKNGGVISASTVLREALTADDWYQRFKKTQK